MLAARAYRAFAAKVPDITLVRFEGRIASASALIDNARPPTDGELQLLAPSFIVDVWLNACEPVLEDYVPYKPETYWANVLFANNDIWRLDVGGILDASFRNSFSDRFEAVPDDVWQNHKDWVGGQSERREINLAYGALTAREIERQISQLSTIAAGEEYLQTLLQDLGFDEQEHRELESILLDRRDGLIASATSLRNWLD